MIIYNNMNSTQVKVEYFETDKNYIASMGVKVSVIADATNHSRFSCWVDISLELADLLYVEICKIMNENKESSLRKVYDLIICRSAEIVLDEILYGNIDGLNSDWNWAIKH